jgi:hypothetical protein
MLYEPSLEVGFGRACIIEWRMHSLAVEYQYYDHTGARESVTYINRISYVFSNNVLFTIQILFLYVVITYFIKTILPQV